MKFYGTIEKVEDQDDGTVLVSGYASTEATDSQGEIVKREAIEAALPDYMKFANIREMHQPKAAGVAIGASVDEQGLYLEARVVDSEAVKKVKAGVYKGFSIGGNVTARDDVNKTTITGLRLSEISLVDRPANPEAVFDCWKGDGIAPEALTPEQAVTELAELLTKGEVDAVELLDIAKRKFSQAARDKAADKGQAMPDGSYPIANKSDLENAIKAYGRAKDPEAVKRHIIKRAKALKLTKELPEDWGVKTKADATDDLAKYMGEEVFDIARALSALDAVYSLYAGEASEDEQNAEQLAALKTVIDNLKAFISSEAAEPMDEPMQMADGAEDLQKAGAKFSTATRKQLGDLHDMVKKCDQHLSGMGYAEKADEPEDLNKIETPADLLAKVEELREEMRKTEEAHAAEREALAKRVQELEDEPEAAKGAVRAISKAEDMGASEEAAVDPVKKDDGTVDDAATLIKKIHSAPGQRIG